MANKCNCPNPPGGVVICEGNQMALCIIENGDAVQRCINPPQNRYYKEYKAVELVNWAIEKITDQKRFPEEEVTQFYIDILKSGEYSTYNYVARFSLPNRILKALDDLDDGMWNKMDNDNGVVIS